MPSWAVHSCGAAVYTGSLPHLFPWLVLYMYADQYLARIVTLMYVVIFCTLASDDGTTETTKLPIDIVRNYSQCTRYTGTRTDGMVAAIVQVPLFSVPLLVFSKHVETSRSVSRPFHRQRKYDNRPTLDQPITDPVRELKSTVVPVRILCDEPLL